MPTSELEENVDGVSLRCLADANPPATIIWRRIGGAPSSSSSSLSSAVANAAPAPNPTASDIYSFQETLDFRPVTRQDSATYSCEAKNVVGTSNTITVPIDVKCNSLIH